MPRPKSQEVNTSSKPMNETDVKHQMIMQRLSKISQETDDVLSRLEREERIRTQEIATSKDA